MSEALEHYEHAYEALKEAPRALGRAALRCDPRLGPGGAQAQAVPGSGGGLKEAEKIARELNDEARLVQILHWIANAYISNGFPGRGMPALFESYQLAEAR